MGGWAIGAGGGGPHMAAAGRGRQTYPPGPLTLNVRLRSGRDNRGNFTITGVGTIEAEKKTEKAAGPANKEHIWIEYRSILGGHKGADR
jgi:hypothetical protein